MKEVIQIANPNMSYGAVMGAIIFILSRAGHHIQKYSTSIDVFGTSTLVSVCRNSSTDVSPWEWIASEVIITSPKTNPVSQAIVSLIQKELPTILVLG
ncbi:MAG: hypothetical protein WCL18_02630 [bacterium]